MQVSHSLPLKGKSMSSMPYAASFPGRFPEKELNGYRDRLEYKTFAEYRQALLNTYREFDGAPPQTAGHMFCGAPDAEMARNFFINANSDESKLPDEGAILLEHTPGENDIFFRRFIDPSHIWDIAIIDALRTGDPGFLVEGAELSLRFAFRSRFLHRLRPEDKYFLAIRSSRHGALINDHASFEGRVLMAYGCGRPDLARRFFQRGMGLSLLDTSSATVNLCFAAMYGDPELWEQAMRLSAPDLKKRKGKSFQAHAKVFIGVMERDADAVSGALAAVGAAQPLSYWGHTRDRIVNISHHGLCAFAREHLPPDVFAQVAIPKANGWWVELFEETGKLTAPRPFVASRYVFGEELSFLDEMAREIDRAKEPSS